MDNFRTIIIKERIKRGYSRRKLGRIIGEDHTKLNKIEKNMVKKVNAEVIAKIATEFDLDLKSLLRELGYNTLVNWFEEREVKNEKTI